jgi:hypothetical protein
MDSVLRKFAIEHRHVANCREVVRQLGDTYIKLRALPQTRDVARVLVRHLETANAAAETLNIAVRHLDLMRDAVRITAIETLRRQPMQRCLECDDSECRAVTSADAFHTPGHAAHG